MDLCSIVGAKKATDLGRLFERKRFESREEAQGSQRGGRESYWAAAKLLIEVMRIKTKVVMVDLMFSRTAAMR